MEAIVNKPEIGDMVKWQLSLQADKETHLNKVVRVTECKFPHWFSTTLQIWLDNGNWIREQDIIEIIPTSI